jgi:hypothetical protein
MNELHLETASFNKLVNDKVKGVTMPGLHSGSVGRRDRWFDDLQIWGRYDDHWKFGA